MITKQGWITRKERYGSSGVRDLDSMKEKLRKKREKQKIVHSKKTKQKISSTQKKNWENGKISINSGAFQGGSQHPNWKDGRSKFVSPGRYGDGWEIIRRFILYRDNFTCQECGEQNKRMDVHHKIPFLTCFNNKSENLITLCRSCHSKITIKEMRSWS